MNAPSPRITAMPVSVWLPGSVAVATFALIVVRAVRTVDVYWDTLAYHWAFAARAAGLCDRECFLMPAGMESRYDGFPMLLHTAQGYLWRLTGTPGMADLVNIGMVAALCVYLRKRFEVPLAWSWLAFLAIPEVQIQLTSSYIDVPVNAAVTLALMAAMRMLVEPEADSRADGAVALAALGLAAGSKFQMIPIALLAWTAITVQGARRPESIGFKRPQSAFAALCLAGILVLMPKLAQNALNFGNPFYPVILNIGHFHLPGVESLIADNSVSDGWAARPRSLRWIASVLEFDAIGGRPLPWVLGQGDVPQSSPAFRMGGYFVSYVLGALGLLGWLAGSVPRARPAATMMIVLSIVCAVTPGSHELRYNMYWMLTLVALVLAVVHAPAFRSAQQPTARALALGLVAVALASVVAMTGGAYLRTGGPKLYDLIRPTEAQVAQIADGATLCIRDKDIRALLYASLFHPAGNYRTHQLEGDERDSACTVRLSLERWPPVDATTGRDTQPTRHLAR